MKTQKKGAAVRIGVDAAAKKLEVQGAYRGQVRRSTQNRRQELGALVLGLSQATHREDRLWHLHFLETELDRHIRLRVEEVVR